MWRSRSHSALSPPGCCCPCRWTRLQSPERLSNGPRWSPQTAPVHPEERDVFSMRSVKSSQAPWQRGRVLRKDALRMRPILFWPMTPSRSCLHWEPSTPPARPQTEPPPPQTSIYDVITLPLLLESSLTVLMGLYLGPVTNWRPFRGSTSRPEAAGKERTPSVGSMKRPLDHVCAIFGLFI